MKRKYCQLKKWQATDNWSRYKPVLSCNAQINACTISDQCDTIYAYGPESYTIKLYYATCQMKSFSCIDFTIPFHYKHNINTQGVNKHCRFGYQGDKCIVKTLSGTICMILNHGKFRNTLVFLLGECRVACVSKPAMYEVTLAHRAPRDGLGAETTAAWGGEGGAPPTLPAVFVATPAVLCLQLKFVSN